MTRKQNLGNTQNFVNTSTNMLAIRPQLDFVQRNLDTIDALISFGKMLSGL